MAAGLHVGVNEILYRNTGTHGSPTWSAVTIARDVSLNIEKSKAEVKSRTSTWATTMPAIKSATLEFELLGDTSVAGYDAIRDYFINDTLVDFAIADQAIATSGCEYFRADFYVYGFSVDQKLEEAQVAKVTAELGYSSNAPAFVNV
jgi:hypothetical protein